jgi:hypothetical protein
VKGSQPYFLWIDKTFAQNILAPGFKGYSWWPLILLPVFTYCSTVPFTHETWVLGIYLFIRPFATCIALGQVKQVLKHKSIAPSQTNLQDLHKFS